MREGSGTYRPVRSVLLLYFMIFLIKFLFWDNCRFTSNCERKNERSYISLIQFPLMVIPCKSEAQFHSQDNVWIHSKHRTSITKGTWNTHSYTHLLPSTQFLQLTTSFCISILLSFQKCHLNKITQYETFYDQLFSLLGIIPWWFITVLCSSAVHFFLLTTNIWW